MAERASSYDRVRIEVIDPTCAGTGIHTRDQPDYLLLNTVCSQVTMFAEAASTGTNADEPGPNLYAWARERDLRLATDGFTIGPVGRPIRIGDFLPRRILGEYLAWFLQTAVLDKASERVDIRFHRQRAVDIRSGADDELVTMLEDGSTVTTQSAVLTTGHTSNDPPIAAALPQRIISDPYPLPDRLHAVSPAESVAINGFGLSAMDMIAACTVGRGGRFISLGGVLQYVRGGAEPQIYLFSRSGSPYRARPKLKRERTPYIPIVLTYDRIEMLRQSAGPLNFDADVLPLLLTEMRVAYHRCRAALTGGEHGAQRLVAELTQAAAAGAAVARLDQLDRRYGPFDADVAWDRSLGMVVTDSAAYQRWVTHEIRRDLVEAAQGLERSCEKAAIEVVRELRDTVRRAVDFGGLTSESLDAFMHARVPLMNKAVVGPQSERHQELLALIEAGVLQVPFGPAPQMTWDASARQWTIASTGLGTPFACGVDWICSANVRAPSVSSSACPLIRRLHAKGWLSRHSPQSVSVHSADIDTDQHPVAAGGRADPRLWILGPLCEGTTFYNHAVPAPGGYSRVVADAHATATKLLNLDRPSGPAEPIHHWILRGQASSSVSVQASAIAAPSLP